MFYSPEARRRKSQRGCDRDLEPTVCLARRNEDRGCARARPTVRVRDDGRVGLGGERSEKTHRTALGSRRKTVDRTDTHTRASNTLAARTAIHRAPVGSTPTESVRTRPSATGARTERIRTRTRIAFNWTARTPFQRHSPAARLVRRCSRSQAPAIRGRFSSMLWVAAGWAA